MSNLFPRLVWRATQAGGIGYAGYLGWQAWWRGGLQPEWVGGPAWAGHLALAGVVGLMAGGLAWSLTGPTRWAPLRALTVGGATLMGGHLLRWAYPYLGGGPLGVRALEIGPFRVWNPAGLARRYDLLNGYAQAEHREWEAANELGRDARRQARRALTDLVERVDPQGLARLPVEDFPDLGYDLFQHHVHHYAFQPPRSLGALSELTALADTPVGRAALGVIAVSALLASGAAFGVAGVVGYQSLIVGVAGWTGATAGGNLAVSTAPVGAPMMEVLHTGTLMGGVGGVALVGGVSSGTVLAAFFSSLAIQRGWYSSGPVRVALAGLLGAFWGTVAGWEGPVDPVGAAPVVGAVVGALAVESAVPAPAGDPLYRVGDPLFRPGDPGMTPDPARVNRALALGMAVGAALVALWAPPEMWQPLVAALAGWWRG